MRKVDSVTFITGNKHKAKQVSVYLDFVVEHMAMELSEIQSLDSREIVAHKVREAYHQIQKPVLVEDVSLRFASLGKLPGPFIKWFLTELRSEKLCMLLNPFSDRSAIAHTLYGFFDGVSLEFFDGEVAGSIADWPRGEFGFGFDSIFIPDGYEKTRAEMDESEYERTSPRRIALKKVERFLKGDDGQSS